MLNHLARWLFSNVVDFEIFRNFNLRNLHLVGDFLHLLLRLLFSLPALLFSNFSVGFLSGRFHLLNLGAFLCLNERALCADLGFGFFFRRFFLIVITFLSVVLLKPLDKFGQKRLYLLLRLAVVEDTVLVELLLTSKPVDVELIWVQALLIKKLEEVHKLGLQVGVFAEIQNDSLKEPITTVVAELLYEAQESLFVLGPARQDAAGGGKDCIHEDVKLVISGDIKVKLNDLYVNEELVDGGVTGGYQLIDLCNGVG